MGMIIFIIASGLTLVFGLMDVLNFGHGVFIALGAFVAISVLGGMADWTTVDDVWRNLGGDRSRRCSAAHAGRRRRRRWRFERVLVRPVYGQHLKQILITMGGMIIGEELIKVIWGPAADSAASCRTACAAPSSFGDAAIEKYRAARGGRSGWSSSPRCCSCSTAPRSAC